MPLSYDVFVQVEYDPSLVTPEKLAQIVTDLGFPSSVIDQAEAGMVEVVENILVNAEEICNTEIPSLNSSFINGVTDELASRTSDTQSCFHLNTRVTGTDIRGSVIKKVVRTSDQECQKSCEQEPQCEYFLSNLL